MCPRAQRRANPSAEDDTMDRIYLDWNATAPMLAPVREAMVRALERTPGNASSIHREGQAARSVIERARRAVAAAVGAPPQAVVLVGGATEGNNQVLRAHARYHPEPYIVSSAVEHPSVLEVVEALGAEPGVRTGRLGVDARGRLDLERARELLASGVTLLSVMWANNELGNLYPIAELVELAHSHGAQLHVDATQALGRVPVDLGRAPVDWLTLSFHKMGGPKGIGAVVVREGLELEAMLAGGHQERGRRPGTENVPAAAGLEVCARLIPERIEEWGRGLSARRALLLESLGRACLGFEVRGDDASHLPNTANVAFEGVDGEDLLLALDLAGVAASSGSACTAGSLEPSHVLLAMGYARAEAMRSLRLSWGPTTPEAALEEAAARIGQIVARLRRLGGR